MRFRPGKNPSQIVIGSWRENIEICTIFFCLMHRFFIHILLLKQGIELKCVLFFNRILIYIVLNL